MIHGDWINEEIKKLSESHIVRLLVSAENESRSTVVLAKDVQH